MTLRREHMIDAGEIAFLDSAISDLNTLTAGIRPGIEKVVLSPAESAISQIVAAVRGREGLRTLHILAHGRPGEVSFLGNPRPACGRLG